MPTSSEADDVVEAGSIFLPCYVPNRDALRAWRCNSGGSRVSSSSAATSGHRVDRKGNS